MKSSNPDSELDPKIAKSTLETIEDVSARATDQGRYSRQFAVAYSLWGGALGATAGMAVWPLVIVSGLLAGHFHRRRSSAWIQEVPTRNSFRAVLGFGLSLGALIILCFVARVDLGQPWISWSLGAIISVILYSVAEMGYGAAWDQKNND